LVENGTEAAIADAYVELLKRCDQALYAGMDKADDLQATYDTARDLILRTEKVK